MIKRTLWLVVLVIVVASAALAPCGRGLQPLGKSFQSAAGKDEKAGPEILFNAKGGLWLIHPDGSGLKQVTTSANANRLYFSASFSPDGRKIGFVDYRALGQGSHQKNSNVWVMNADGSGVTPLTGELNRYFNDLSWSPEGKIATISGRFQVVKGKNIRMVNSNIWVIRADGSPGVQVTRFKNPDVGIARVRWSPDGRKIAFLSNRALQGGDNKPPVEGQNIWVMNADGSHLMPLTRLTGKFPFIFALAWSPDSQNLTCISSRALDGSDSSSGGENIWVVHADGSGSHPLTRFEHVACRAFDWSPDGTRLAFSSNGALDGSDVRSNADNIWVMSASGSNPAPLTFRTEFASKQSEPLWSPDGSMIAFVSCIEPNSRNHATQSVCDLWVMNSDGTGARKLVDHADPEVMNVKVIGWRP